MNKHIKSGFFGVMVGCVLCSLGYTFITWQFWAAFIIIDSAYFLCKE